MSYYRSYFEKNNTIIKNFQVNTSKNPTTEIFYGSTHSRFIFKLNLTDLKYKIDNNILIPNSNTKHTLHLTNTIFGDNSLIGQYRGNGRERAVSFRLEVFKLIEEWSEGVGFDYEETEHDFTYGNKTFDERPSNWFKKDTINDWDNQGAYAGSGTTIGYIDFDNGNEDINYDITDYVNGILLSGNTNYGLGLKFLTSYEILEPEIDKSVAFFSKYTQTFFEPYLESFFDDKIIDNRYNFIEKTEQNLYLYITKGTNFYNLDNNPTVDVLDASGAPIVGLTGLTTTHVKKGVYKVSFGVDGVICDGKKFFYDKWKNIEIDNVSLPDITQKFTPKPYTTLYSIGNNPTDTVRYAIQFHGIKQHEKIKRGEIRKVVITFRNIQNPTTVVFENVFYRIFIKEGKTDVIIHDWTQIDSTNENSFVFDTSYFIPREYFMEIKGLTHGEEIFYPNIIAFEILSEK